MPSNGWYSLQYQKLKTAHCPGLMTQYLVLARFLFNRETRWNVGIPGVCIAFSALWGRLQSCHCQATTHQQENNTSRDQCECTYCTHCKLADIICYHADIYSELIWHITYSTTWTAKLYATRQTYLCTDLFYCVLGIVYTAWLKLWSH